MIREARDSDVPGLVRLLDEVQPEGINSPEAIRHRLARPPRARALTVVAEEAGTVVGRATAGFQLHSERHDVAFVNVAVAEASRRRGIGSALYERAEMHLREHGARRLLAESADTAEARRFAAGRGFEHTMTRRISSLDPRLADVSELQRLRADRERAGFELVAMSAFRDRPEEIHALDAEASRDIPVDEPIVDVRFDEWERAHWRHPLLSLDGSFVALADGRPVSFTMLLAHTPSGKAANEMTGTLRDYRGLGLARLVKLATIDWAARSSIGQMVTENDETNAPMLALNTRLGYRPFATLLAWVRESRATAPHER